MTARLNQSLRDLTKEFLALLADAQDERETRRDLVAVNGETLCGWELHERTVMHDAVNRVRTENGLTPAPIEAVARVENLAVGHSDYSQKYAFYCAEIAQGYGDFPKQGA